MSPRAKYFHSYVVSRIMFELHPLEAQGFVVLAETACRLTTDSLPNTDACVVDRAKHDAAMANGDFVRDSPVLVIEVHSLSNTKRKIELYLEHGADECWVLYPKKRTVTMYNPGRHSR